MLDLVTDHEIRAAAFALVRRLQDENGGLSWRQLQAGFRWKDDQIALDWSQRGIWKPRQMTHLLSIKTTFGAKGAKYADQRQVHRQFFEDRDVIDYAFMGTDPRNASNQHLKAACERQVPIIYFLASATGFYQALLPSYIVDWDPKRLMARVAFGYDSPPETADQRRLGLAVAREHVQRAGFREGVLAAYGGRCAVSQIGGRSHIAVAELAPAFGPAAALPAGPAAGVALSKLHRSAFDADLIGIDSDGYVHVSERAAEYRVGAARRSQPDSPLIDALLAVDGRRISLPQNPEHRPDRGLLDMRYRQFLRAN